MLSDLSRLITNHLPALPDNSVLVGIIGDQPSSYAKSPTIWNPTIKSLGLEAVYLPFDVPAGRLGQTIAALRQIPEYIGGNVTVPYKVDIMQYLDRIDPVAEAIGAVNTIARDESGLLVGYNTDGQGAIDALIRTHPDHDVPFVGSLAGQRVLLLGAGGAARAVAFCLGRELKTGCIWIANRTIARSDLLCAHLQASGIPVEVAQESDLPGIMERTTLVVNATSVGQSGLRSLPDGRYTILEPYSPLAPFSVESVTSSDSEVLHAWSGAVSDDIVRNARDAWEMVARLPTSACCFDLIYSPLETVFLQQARLSGHSTMNGKSMNVCQAVTAFLRVMQLGLTYPEDSDDELYTRVHAHMYRVW